MRVKIAFKAFNTVSSATINKRIHSMFDCAEVSFKLIEGCETFI